MTPRISRPPTLFRRVVATALQAFFVLFLASAAPLASAMDDSSSTGSRRHLASLAQKWNITGPEFGSNELEFQLNYTVSDFILPEMIQHQLYDSNCAEGGITLPSSTLTTQIDTDTTVPPGEGDLSRSVKITVTIDPETISNTNIYSEEVVDNQLKATIVFCHRLMLFTTSVTPIEVNFRETVVTFYVDLTDGFEIGNIDVQDKDKLVRTANQAYEVEGYQCDFSNQKLSDVELSQSRQQGTLIRVCVRPEEEARTDGIFMRSIDQFVWERDYGGSVGVVTQVAVEDGEAAANQLTQLWCTPGDEVCAFESVLLALFFRLPGSVEGAGIASMQFGNFNGGARRSLRRGLQQGGDDAAAGLAEFDLSMELIPFSRPRRDDSAAYSNRHGRTILFVAGACTTFLTWGVLA